MGGKEEGGIRNDEVIQNIQAFYTFELSVFTADFSALNLTSSPQSLVPNP